MKRTTSVNGKYFILVNLEPYADDQTIDEKKSIIWRPKKIIGKRKKW